MKQSEVNFTKKLAYAFDHLTAEIAQRLRVGKDGQFEPRTKISLWSMIAIPEDWPFLKKQLVLQNDFMQVMESYTTVCPISLHAGIVSYESEQYKQSAFTFFGSLYEKKIKMSVTSIIIHSMHNWKWYHSIDLAKSFLLKYRCWTFTKVTANTFMRSSEHLASLLTTL